MGIKLGPKLDLSFWSLGYIVLAVVLVIFNISWISGSISSTLLGRKERAVFDADTTAPSQDYLNAIDTLIKDHGLDAKKREILLARSARLSYNLKLTEKARAEYDELTNSKNDNIKLLAELSIITIDFEGKYVDSATSEVKAAAVAEALKKLDDLALRNPQSVDVKAAQGALYLNYFTQPDSATYVGKCSDLLKSIKALSDPGIVDSRRNVLMIDLAVRGFVLNPTADEDKITKNLQEEAKRIAPYIAGVKKSTQVLILEQYRAAAEENAVSPMLLGQLANVPGVMGDEYTQLINTCLPGTVPTLTTPKAHEISKIMMLNFKNAIRFSPRNPMNYDNGAAFMAKYATIQDAQLDAVIRDLRDRGVVPPVPFDTSDKPEGSINSAVSEVDHSLTDALWFLHQGMVVPEIDAEHRAIWAAHAVDISLWRAALVPPAMRPSLINTALQDVVSWHDLDPKNPKMMLMTSKVYEMQGKSEEAKTWLDKYAAAGGTVAGGPVKNDFRFVTVYPGNLLQVNATDCTIHDEATLIGGTFLVQGYTEALDSNSVTLKLNGKLVRVHCLDGIAFAVLRTEDMLPQNSFELKLALSPQLVKLFNGTFRFTVSK